MSTTEGYRRGWDKLSELVADFAANADYYRSQQFNESAARLQFIDPFWRALGWDVGDQHDRLGPAREVLVEQGQRAEPDLAGIEDWDSDLSDEELADRVARNTFPDYVFRVDEIPRFVCEAKKPAVSLRGRGPSFQAKSYGWSMRLPIAVLTDFEELRVFDARFRPQFDSPNAGVRPGLDLRFDQYLENWDRIWTLLSREAVVAGSLENFSAAVSAKGSTPVDRAFLAELSRWRELVASDLLGRNPDLTRWEVADATQRILDRVVFIRVMEDRGVLDTILLRRFARVTDAYRRLTVEFRRLDSVYNGQLFAPHFSERLELSDSVFQGVVEALYWPTSPYRFDAIPADLLGSIYERFLGQEIEIIDGQVEIADKPEVRHAGGVYYTPRWIVDEIVRETIGPLVHGKTPRGVANIRIVDPACGSGAFLLGAFDFLVRWHERYFEDHPDETPDRHFVAESGERRLTADAKGAIVRQNLYGVDIDPQAVEVTQMALYLGILEHESLTTLTDQPRLFHTTFLPRLTENIRCGNSLLSMEDLEGGQLFFEEEQARRMNPFDWWSLTAGFGEVLASRGGFDAVIGNPPYTRVQVLFQTRPEEVRVYQSKYRSAASGSFDIASPFVERGLELLRKDGRLGYIVTRQFCEADSGQPLRALLASRKHVARIVDFGDGFVFESANAYTVLLELTKRTSDEWTLVRVPAPPSAHGLRAAAAPRSQTSAVMDATTLLESPWDLALPAERDLLDRLASEFPTLGEVCGDVIFQAPVTGADYVFRLNDLGPDKKHPGRRIVRHRTTGATGTIESALLRPVWAGSSDIRRFRSAKSREVLLVPYLRDSPEQAYRLASADELDAYPGARSWLAQYEAELRARAGRWDNSNWWGFSRRQNLELWDSDKIAIPYMVDELAATLDPDRHWMVNVSTGGYGIPAANLGDPELVSALLNSELLSWTLRRYSRAFGGGWFAARKGNLVRLPVLDGVDQQTRDALVDAHEQCMAAADALGPEPTPEERQQLEELAAGFDSRVYDAYSVTPVEVMLIRSDVRRLRA